MQGDSNNIYVWLIKNNGGQKAVGLHIHSAEYVNQESYL